MHPDVKSWYVLPSPEHFVSVGVALKPQCGLNSPSIPLLSSSQDELLSNSQPLSLAHCLLPTQQPCEHLCEHSSLLSLLHVFKLSPSPSLLLSHSPISLFASPVVIYVVVSMEHWLGAKQALPPHGHLLGSRNSTGQPQYLCIQTYRSSGMHASPTWVGLPSWVTWPHFICDHCTCCTKWGRWTWWNAKSTQLRPNHENYIRWWWFHGGSSLALTMCANTWHGW